MNGRWRFRRIGNAEWMDASVPGCVHTDLFASGAIEDPYYGCNEVGLQWISDNDWEYEKTFLVEPSFLEYPRHELVFEGLDTRADIRLNGSHILSAGNMFREWRVDCGKLLRPGENTVSIVFHSPFRVEEALAGKYLFGLPGGNRVFTRKAAYHYGWDWGPRYVTMGIWRPARIVAWKEARLANASYRLDRLEPAIESGEEIRSAAYIATLAIEAERAAETTVKIYVDGRAARISRPGIDEESAERLRIGLSRGTNSIDLRFEIPNPELWWPNGMGGHRLYEIGAAVFVDEEETSAITGSIGVRTVDLVTAPGGGGEGFHFMINGRPAFMKGANWIPMESFPSAARDERYRSLVESAATANMNMLRVWGGGIYEKEIFYSLCDSSGILVWQDFMFANAMYPWDDEFLENVEAEAAWNVRRLADHPCIALWCGNNEIDEAWHNWGWRDGYTEDESTAIWDGYGELFGKILPNAVSAHGNGAPYISTSPKYGRGDRRSLAGGDCHYWGVWHDAEPFEALLTKTGRFMSEFGFQSFPTIETVSCFSGVAGDAAVPDCLDSPELLCHQKHPRGNGLILEYMRRDYDVPERFEDFVYVSRLLQARGVRIGIEAQRRASPFCMGSLFWQLNDCWPAVSWSCVDYFGERKALYYHAAKAFSPEIVSPVVENDTIRIYVVSDSPVPLEFTLRLSLIDFEGDLIREISRILPPPAVRGAPAFQIPLRELIADRAPGAVVLRCELLSGGETAAENLLYFASPKDLNLPDPRLKVAISEIPEGGGLIIELRTEKLAKDVYLSLPGCAGLFSDNYFDIPPGGKAAVVCRTRVKPAEAGKSLKIRTLADIE